VTVGEFEAVLVNATLPVALPVAVGANAIEKVVDCPALRVTGKDIPLIAYSLPATVTADIVTLPPDAVSVPDMLRVLPTATLPKASDVGLALKEVVGATPVPLRETAVGLLEALLTIEICPVTLPADAGANCAT
jgi:hypothetical protein